MPLTPAEEAELAALRAGRTTQAVKSTEVSGRKAEFFQPDLAAKDRRIAELDAASRPGFRRRGAIGFRF